MDEYLLIDWNDLSILRSQIPRHDSQDQKQQRRKYFIHGVAYSDMRKRGSRHGNAHSLASGLASIHFTTTFNLVSSLMSVLPELTHFGSSGVTKPI